MLEPQDVASFLRRDWERRALPIRGEPNKWRSFYQPVEWSWLEHAMELEAASSSQGKQHQFRIADRSEVAALFDQGFTICANVSRDPALAPLLVELGQELALAGTPFAKMYASPHDGGFALHFDMFHVFVLQLSGRKRWRFSAQPAVAAPICGGKLGEDGAPVWSFPRDGVPITDDDGAPIAVPELSEVVLEEGDCLYLPPGTWHVAQAIERSVALSVSPPRTPIYKLVARTIEDHLMQNEAWRRDVFSAEQAAPLGGVPVAIAEQFESSIADLKRLLDRLDRRTLHRVWRLNVPSSGSPSQPRGVEPDDVLVHASAELRRYLVALEPHGPEEIFFYLAGSEWSLPIEARPFIEALANAERFVARDACQWDPSLSWADVKEMLEQLVAAGLLKLTDA